MGRGRAPDDLIHLARWLQDTPIDVQGKIQREGVFNNVYDPLQIQVCAIFTPIAINILYTSSNAADAKGRLKHNYMTDFHD